MIHDIGAVEERGGNKPGKQVELYLTEIGRRQYYQQSFELPSQENKAQVSSIKDDISQKLKALYAIILYFNQGVSYRVHTEDAAEYILRSFGLSLSSLVTRFEKNLVKSDSEDVLQDVLQSPREDITVHKDVFLRSEIYERGTTHYRLFLRGITCEAILENKDIKAFRHIGFTSEEIRSAIWSLRSLNILKPMGSLGATIANEVIYKIDKSIFDLMFDLRSLNGYDIFDKIESLMIEIWFNFREPTEDEKDWLHFVYGKREADRLINDAHDSRYKITNGESMNSYFSRIIRNNKEKLTEINNRIDAINMEIIKIKDFIAWIQESNKAIVNRHQILLKDIFEIVYPKFFANLTLERFGVKTKSSVTRESLHYTIESIDPTDEL
jgi:hypothetical protein